jgi:nucleoside-diphosphate-sugar epimerase
MTNGLIAITGATGFVGAHLVDCLRQEGQTVRVLARNPAKVGRDDVEVIAGDLGSVEALSRLCEGAATVIHCAGKTAACSRAEFDAVNIAGTEAVLHAASTARISRFVHVSSLAAREPELSEYSASKRAGEELVTANEGGFSWIVLRPPAVYGPGDKATLPLIKQLTQRVALVPGTAAGRASLIHVRDLAAAIAHVAFDAGLGAAVYELDDGKQGGYSWRELSAAAGEAEGHKVMCVFLPKSVVKLAGAVEVVLARRAKRTPEVTPGKVRELYHPDWVCRDNLLQECSDWHPSVRLADGLRETASWYREQGWM